MSAPACTAVTETEVVAAAPPLDVYDKGLLASATPTCPVERT